jgi:parallel beta-helix repeat protein
MLFEVQIAHGSGTIYIRGNGSIDPSDAPISTFDKITYTFTTNIYDAIVIERDNIIVDGAGYAIQGTGEGRGMDLSGRNNVTIKNTDIKGFYFAIYLDGSSHGNIVSGNNVKNNRIGIELYGSGNAISENSIATNDNGIEIRDCSGNQIFGNTITTNAQTGISLEGNGLAPDRTRDNVVSGNSITENYGGVSFGQYSRYNSIIGNNVSGNIWGIEPYGLGHTISGNNIGGNFGGIYLCGANHTVLENSIRDNTNRGIFIQSSSGNVLRNNIMVNNTNNLGVEGSGLSEFIHDIDESNTIDGKPVCYWVNKYDMTIPFNAGYVGIVNSSNVTINQLELKNNGEGVLLAYTKNSTIINNIFLNNSHGIYSRSSSGNNITQNSMTSNSRYGIYLDGSHSNNISQNNMTNNMGSGMRFDWSHNNVVSENNIVANKDYGIWLSQSSDNDIFGNKIENNHGGVRLSKSSDNKFYHNYFTNNTPQVYDEAQDGWTTYSINIWDDGYPSGGNYWSNYTDIDLYCGPHQNETGSDEIWDHPYIIDGGNRDNYPTVPEFSSLIILPLFVIATLLAVIVNRRKQRKERH